MPVACISNQQQEAAEEEPNPNPNPNEVQLQSTVVRSRTVSAAPSLGQRKLIYFRALVRWKQMAARELCACMVHARLGERYDQCR